MKVDVTRRIFGVVCAVLVCGLGYSTLRGQSAPAAKPQMAEQVFKNIQVLRGIPVDEFMDTMGMFAAALSLNCVDCHAANADSSGSWDAFAVETPLKVTSRRMVLMVNALNKANFAGARRVTCWTCHRGDQKPKHIASLALQYTEPPSDPNDAEIPPGGFPGAPSADQIFDRYFQAIGGAQRVAGITSIVGKGTYVGFETSMAKIPVEIYAKAPNQRVTIVHTAFGDSVRTYDGQSGWIASSDKPLLLMPLTGGKLDGARLEALASFPAQFRQAFKQWQVGLMSMGDKDMYVLEGTGGAELPVRLFFDMESGLLVRQANFSETAVGTVPTQIDYTDYRDVSGVKIPFSWTTTWTTGQATTELTDVQLNASIDAARFARPAPAPQPKF
jgi:outer membrane lipoprotein-sorting protein